jgi:sugar lactone lactonase YvrE
MPDPLGASRAHIRRASLSPIAPVGASGLSHADGVPIPALVGVTDSVYWVDRTQGTVYRRALNNSVQLNQSAPGSSVATLATNQSQVSDLAHRTGTLYVVSDAGVARVSVSTPGATTLTTLTNAPRGVSVDESHVYWADTGTKRVRAVPIDGGAPVTVWDAGTETPFDTFSTSAFIYVTTEQGTVARVPKTVQ